MAPKRYFQGASDDESTASKRSKTAPKVSPPKGATNQRDKSDVEHGNIDDTKATKPKCSKSKQTTTNRIPVGLSSQDKEVFTAAVQEAADAWSQVKKLTQDIGRLRDELQSSQSKLLAGISSGTNQVQGQSEIMKMFCSLKKKIYDFAANHALGGHISSHLNSQDCDAVIRVLCGTYPTFPYQALTKPNKAPLFLRLIGGPRVGAQTIIEHLVSYEILSCPLHFLPTATQKAFHEIAARKTGKPTMNALTITHLLMICSNFRHGEPLRRKGC